MEQNSVQVGCLGFCTVNHYDGWPSPKIRSLADLPWLPCFIKLTPGPKVKAGFSQIASCRRGGRGAWCFLAAPQVSQVLPRSISLMPGWTKTFLLVWYLCVSEYSGNKNVTLKLFFFGLRNIFTWYQRRMKNGQGALLSLPLQLSWPPKVNCCHSI